MVVADQVPTSLKNVEIVTKGTVLWCMCVCNKCPTLKRMKLLAQAKSFQEIKYIVTFAEKDM